MRKHLEVIRKLTGPAMRPLATIDGPEGMSFVWQDDNGQNAFFYRASFVKQARTAEPSVN